MGLLDDVKVLRAGWRLLAAVVVLTACAGLAISLATSASYVATASLSVLPPNDATTAQAAAAERYARASLGSYQQLGNQSVVLDPAIQELGLRTSTMLLQPRVKIRARRDSILLKVVVREHSPALAARVANAVAERLVAAVLQLLPGTTAPARPIRFEVVKPATVPAAASQPRTRLNVAVATLVGCIGGAVLVLWRDGRSSSDSQVDPGGSLGLQSLLPTA